MRILLVQNTTYVPAHGGANKATRAIIEGLAERGHTCCAIARASASQAGDPVAQITRELSDREIAVSSATPDVVTFRHKDVEVYAVAQARNMRAQVSRRIAELEPDRILVTSEDPGQRLLETCLPNAVYFAQTTLLLPFGPAGALTVSHGREVIRRAAGVIVVSDYLKSYFRLWAEIESTVIRPPVFGPGPFPRFGRPDRGFITIVNPSAVKGIDIFIELARKRPDVEFAAVMGWGTTAADESALRALPNVRLLQPVDDLGDVLRQTRILLMPSIWAEAFGCVAIEAMLHGIPVLASDVGGLPEAKLGVEYVLPVRPIERYEPRLDDRMLPIPIVPRQDCGPWLDALGDLLDHPASYERVAARSRTAATAALADIGVDPFDRYLQALG